MEWTCEVVEGELLKKQILIYARVPPSRGPRTWDAHGNAFRVRWHVIKYIEYHVTEVSVQGTSPHLNYI